MRLYLVRHAPAEERDPRRWPDDGERPLSKTGTAKFTRAARGLRRTAAPPERVLSSPLVRAWHTAMILHETAGWPAPEPCDALGGGEDAAAVLPVLDALSGAASAALVGHEPLTGELAALLLTGTNSALRLEFKKGAVLCLELSEIAPGRAHLLWHAQPRLLRAMAR